MQSKDKWSRKQKHIDNVAVPFHVKHKEIIMNRIGLIVALDGEANSLYKTLGTIVKEEMVGMTRITEFEYGGTSLYLAWSGIGEIAAAVAATTLIHLKQVEAIINFGLVGSLKGEYKAKDLVLVDEVVHYDFTLDYADQNMQGKYWFNRDSYVNKVDYGIFRAVAESLGVRKIRIASGDKFINDSTLKNYLVNTFDCDVADMESMGIYIACMNNYIPCVMIKAVSDNADESAEVDFQSIVSGSVDYYIDAVHKLITAVVK